jgi:hypothetical protein
VRHIFKISIFLFLFCSAAKADYTAAQAEELYRSGDWKKAAEAYKALTDQAIKQGSATAPLFYNFGTALAKSGSVGEAYVVFWKAFFLAPLDSDIRFNLSLAESNLPEAVKSVKPDTWFLWWPEAALPLSYKIWLSVSLIFLAGFLWLQKSSSNIQMKMGLAFGFLLFLILGSLSFYQTNEKAAGLITAAKTRSGPDQSFPEITSLDAGSLVTLEEMRDGWYKIRFQSGESSETVGWVPAGSVMEVN